MKVWLILICLGWHKYFLHVFLCVVLFEYLTTISMNWSALILKMCSGEHVNFKITSTFLLAWSCLFPHAPDATGCAFLRKNYFYPCNSIIFLLQGEKLTGSFYGLIFFSFNCSFCLVYSQKILYTCELWSFNGRKPIFSRVLHLWLSIFLSSGY
jgi:hypothetical protein